MAKSINLSIPAHTWVKACSVHVFSKTADERLRSKNRRREESGHIKNGSVVDAERRFVIATRTHNARRPYNRKNDLELDHNGDTSRHEDDLELDHI